MRKPLRPLDFLGRIKVKLGIVILLAVATAFVVNEVGINAGYSRNVRVAVAVVLALIMVQLLARGMTKPLREMAAAAQTIAKGRYGLRVTATSRDEVGELARAFNAMAADLGEVDRQRRELVANVSHELRTPITALRAVLENVVDGVSDPDPVTLGTALAQTERLGRLVAQLLDLSRLESGARLIDPESLELRPLCEQALREAVLARDGVTARCEVPAGLSVRADADLLAQVLANLLDNAVRHSPEGGVVVLAAAAQGGGVRLRVTDQGPGIAPEERARAFERFSRLDAGRAADEGGAGLGLAITKEIVELHGGSIRVEDGVGCRVAVDLPERTMMDGPSPGDPMTSSPDPLSPAESVDLEELPAPAARPVPETAAPAGTRATATIPPDPVDSPDLADAADPADLVDSPDPVDSADRVDPVETLVASGADSAGAGATVVDVTETSAESGASPTPPGPPVPAGYGSGPAVPGSGTPGSGAPGPAGPSGPGHAPFPATGGAGGHGYPVPLRNWWGAVIGVFVGGFIGLAFGVLLGLGVGAVSIQAGLALGVLSPVIGGFVGTVIGATTPPSGVWESSRPAGGVPAPRTPVTPPHPSAQGREGRPAGPALDGAGTGRTQGPGDPAGAARPAGETHRTQEDTHRTAVAQRGAPAGREGHGGAPDGSGTPGEPRGLQGSGTPGGLQGPGTPGEYVAPSVFPRPQLPGTPRWVPVACAVVGLLAAVALPYSSVGLGFVLVAAAMGVVALPVVRRRITPWSAGMGVIAYGMVVMAVFRDADWLVGLLLLAGFAVAALALSGAGRGWLGVLRGGVSVVLGLLPVPWFLAAPFKGMPTRRRLVPALIGAGLTVVLVAIFGALFASADAVFAKTVENIFTGQDWAESLPLRILTFAVFGVVAASAVLVGLRPVAEPKGPDLRLRVGRGLWVTPLTALNLLFATFVAMQLTVLFGGNGRVLETTDLTYAEYARSGFFQLVVVSVFVLAIVALASGVVDLEGRDRWLMAGLLGLLCGLTVVILISAMYRLDLYVDAYGYTRLRASVGAAIWWLGGIFALVLVAGAVRLTRRAAGWLPRSVVVMTGAGLLAFAVWNPDLRVAESQLSIRGVDRLDQAYLSDLGAEAVPALDRLPEPTRSCVLQAVVQANELDRPDPWNGWNLARQQARKLLAERPAVAGVSCGPEVSRLDIIPDQD
ncbi:DUF4153 domain-containing protein [Planobispora takensis]|uniref:Signal transduction histidine-protein kinase/phosphatase MprB n=1 Tax=Planobispora takensis TaxID=1367882 RepID=A0A8J3SXD9_9ACTN|nr:DUF4153 domain-containing protein [Planobispora takensis]GII01070.1 hypothetical protein Pta02_30780 [Planobispora takensis]